MKKSRIISFLLAAVMMASSLPLASSVSAASASVGTPVGVNLLDGDMTAPTSWTASKVTTEKVSVNDADNNGKNTFLRIDNIVKSDLGYTLTLDVSDTVPNGVLAGGTQYVLKFKLRVQGNSPYGCSVLGSAFVQSTADADDEFETVEYAFTPAENIGSFYFAICGFYVAPGGTNRFDAITPKEIDDVEIYLADASGKATGDAIYTNTFETDEELGQVISWELDSSNKGKAETEQDYLRVGAVAAPSDWNGAEDYYKSASVASKGLSVALVPGVYELSFDARQSYFFTESMHNAAEYQYEYTAAGGVGKPAKGLREVDLDDKRGYRINNVATVNGNDWFIYRPTGTGSDVNPNRLTKPGGNTVKVLSSTIYHIMYQDWPNSYIACTASINAVRHANYRDVAVKLSAGSNALVDQTFKVTDAWGSYKYSFTVPEGEAYTIDALSFGGTGKAYDNDAFDISNLSIKLVHPNKQTVDTNDTENFLNAAVEDYNSGIYSEVRDGGNGYASIDRRPWSWNTDSGKYLFSPNLFRVNLGENFESDTTYYVSFDIRHSVATNTPQRIRACWQWTQALSDTQIPGDTEWHTYTFAYTPDSGKIGQAMWFYLRGDTSGINVPVDVDNIIVWKRSSSAGGTAVFDKKTDTELLNLDFDNSSVNSIGNATKKIYAWDNNASITRKYDEYNRLDATDANKAPVLSYKSLNNGNGHPEGIYTFSADFRIPYYYFENISNVVTTQDSNALAARYALNNHKIKLTFHSTALDGTDPDTSVIIKDASYLWSRIETGVIVDNGRILTGIDIEPVYSDVFSVATDKRALDFKNVRLYHSDFPIVETDEKDNYLSDTTVYVENTIPSEVIYDAPFGNLLVSQRPNDATNPQTFITVNTGAAVKKGTTYYVDFDVTAGAGAWSTVSIRPRVNVATVYEQGITLNKFITGADGNDFTTNSAAGTFNTTKINTLQKFRGQFKADADTNGLIIYIDRGTGTGYNHPLAIDNFRVYYKENGVDKEIYSNNFDFEGAGNDFVPTAGCDYTIEHIYNFSHSLYTPIESDKPMKLTYDVELTDDEKVEGKYQFTAMARLAKASTSPAVAKVTFNYSDGSSEVHYKELTTEWQTIGVSGRLDRYPTFENVQIEFISDVPVMLIEPTLGITYRWQYGRPNSGIVMVLIKKMQGKMTDPWKQLGLG